ncbi:hypothetical protein VNO77_34093 [Canavalia gladiata]|uniref:Uncharacterized protein n=1 Tax=Canavalia gladiata TaxID=3824 RepID=A0AAN9PYZ1_CANGL
MAMVSVQARLNEKLDTGQNFRTRKQKCVENFSFCFEIPESWKFFSDHSFRDIVNSILSPESKEIASSFLAVRFRFFRLRTENTSRQENSRFLLEILQRNASTREKAMPVKEKFPGANHLSVCLPFLLPSLLPLLLQGDSDCSWPRLRKQPPGISFQISKKYQQPKKGILLRAFLDNSWIYGLLFHLAPAPESQASIAIERNFPCNPAKYEGRPSQLTPAGVGVSVMDLSKSSHLGMANTVAHLVDHVLYYATPTYEVPGIHNRRGKMIPALIPPLLAITEVLYCVHSFRENYTRFKGGNEELEMDSISDSHHLASPTLARAIDSSHKPWMQAHLKSLERCEEYIHELPSEIIHEGYVLCTLFGKTGALCMLLKAKAPCSHWPYRCLNNQASERSICASECMKMAKSRSKGRLGDMLYDGAFELWETIHLDAMHGSPWVSFRWVPMSKPEGSKETGLKFQNTSSRW